jgi:hypothetical protein
VNPVLFLLLFAVNAETRACGLIPHAELARVVGVAQPKGVERSGPSHRACDFETESGMISVEIHSVSVNVTLDAQADALAKAFPSADFRKVTVLGVTGLSVRIPDVGTQIHLLTEDRTYVLVSAMGYRNAGEAAEWVVRSLLVRLGRQKAE